MGFIFIDRIITKYFDSFETEYIPQEVLNKIQDKSFTHNVITYNLMIYFLQMIFKKWQN